MDIRDKIFIYNFLTVVFAFLALVSIGGILECTSIFNALMNFGFFAMLAYNCFQKENKLRKIYTHRRHMKKKLSVVGKTATVAKRAA